MSSQITMLEEMVETLLDFLQYALRTWEHEEYREEIRSFIEQFEEDYDECL